MSTYQSTRDRHSVVSSTGGARGFGAAATDRVGGGHAVDPYDISNVGWSSLEHRFHELMDLVNTSSTMGANALQVRQNHQEHVREVINALLSRAEEECRQLLLAGNAAGAEEAGVKVLQLREEFHGKNRPALVPCYIHLARTKQFMEHYGEAEDMLSLAHFIVLQHQDEVTIAVKAELHQSFGLLYAADDQLDAAVKQLTCATYYLSCLYGPRNVLTTFSYFDLGNVFAAKASMESAMSAYDTVKEIWYEHLTQVLEEIVEQRAVLEKLKKYEGDANLFQNGYDSARAFGEDNLADVSKMLYGIFSIQTERYRVAHPSTVKAEFVLGLFLLWAQEEDEAQVHLASARQGSQQFYGAHHPVVQEMEQWCIAFNIDYNNVPQEVSANGAAEVPAGEPAPLPPQTTATGAQ